MSRTFRSPQTKSKDLPLYHAWQTGDAMWLARLLENCAKEVRDGSKMGSRNRDRKDYLQPKRQKLESYRKMVFRLDMAV
jgi:hypothetical protein